MPRHLLPMCSAAALIGVAMAGIASAQATRPATGPATQATADADPSRPPRVSCTSWVIGDGKTGRILWGSEADTPRKAASTTKMMCAYVILSLAEKEPAILDEVVTFSEAADKTTGSTSGIKAGESLTVRECLYGLMLPSGNDAGIALGEHFNARFAPPQTPTTQPRAYSNFVAEMNRMAKTLGMSRTAYRLPYGDGGTADDRTTTAHDLLTLAHHAMKLERFRKYVSTPYHEAHIKRPDGETHRIAWDNTNKLLKLDGYDGIKTGTTTLAKQCLVSSARRDDDHLIVVVLGSDGEDGRYVDSKALFEWAWAQRSTK